MRRRQLQMTLLCAVFVSAISSHLSSLLSVAGRAHALWLVNFSKVVETIAIGLALLVLTITACFN